MVKYSILNNKRRSKLFAVIDCLFFKLCGVTVFASLRTRVMRTHQDLYCLYFSSKVMVKYAWGEGTLRGAYLTTVRLIAFDRTQT